MSALSDSCAEMYVIEASNLRQALRVLFELLPDSQRGMASQMVAEVSALAVVAGQLFIFFTFIGDCVDFSNWDWLELVQFVGSVWHGHCARAC